MPEFELVSRQEAMARSDTGKRSQIIREYVEHCPTPWPGPSRPGHVVAWRHDGHRASTSGGSHKGDG